MSTVNKVILIGNLGDDVKMHHFEGGNSIGRFPIATSESYTNREGEKVTTTEWHNIIVRNKIAEVCEKYLKKGDKIYVEGKIKTRKWQAEDGTDRYSAEIHVRELTFLTTKGNSGSNQQTAQTTNTEKAPDNTSAGEPDDLPF